MTNNQKVKRRKKGCLVLTILLAIVLIIISYLAYQIYLKIFENNLHLKQEITYLYIPSNSDFNDLIKILDKEEIIKNKKEFLWLAKQKNFINKVYAGRYEIKNGMNYNELINLLRSGKQKPLNVTFNSLRTKEQFAGIISKQIEADSLEILDLFYDEKFIKKFNFDKKNIINIFIPNTYEFYWNTSAKKFFTRMAKEFKIFWNKKRKDKAKKINLSIQEVIILASIVEEESKKIKERPTVAGVYINRLKKGMLLQADPTVIFAIGDYSIRRVLHKHLKYKSPYNTYLNKGLPPSPICFPSMSSIKAVLNYEKHKYLFFCAKEDFSGYHNFAKTLKQHNVNAKKYRRALKR